MLKTSKWLGVLRAYRTLVLSRPQQVPSYKDFVSYRAAHASSKEFPTFPNVGIGVVVLRKVKIEPQVLLVRRGNEPQKGQLSFPGGSLELGETMAQCAVREILEETGLQLRHMPPEEEPSPRLLDFPRPFEAVDSIHYDTDGRIKYQYAIIEMAAVPEDALAELTAGDDADEALWAAVSDLPTLPDLAKSCARIAAAAVQRFDIPES